MRRSLTALGAGFSLACLLQSSQVFAADARAGQALLKALQEANKPLAASLISRKADINLQDETGATPLVWAAQRRNAEMVKQLLEAGADPNLATNDGLTALQVALDNKQGDIALMLIAKGAKADVARDTGETALMTAARIGQVEVMKQLLMHGADVNAHENKFNQTALMWAAGNPAAVKLLIEHGADLRARTKAWDVTTTIYTPNVYTIGVTGIPWNHDGEYVAKKGGQSALFFAVQEDDLESVRLILDAGMDVNDTSADGSTALLLSLYKWNIEVGPKGPGGPQFKPNLKIANLLLDRGAKVNVADAAGYTPLHGAALGLVPKGRDGLLEARLRGDGPEASGKPMPLPVDADEALALVKRLLDMKANPNAPTIYPTGGPVGNVRINPAPPGSSPLHVAGMSGNPKLAEALLAHGGNPNLVRKDGHTPFSVAVRANDLAVTTVLADRGANMKLIYNPGDMLGDPVKPFARPRQKVNALHIAAAAGASEVVPFLVQRGVPLNAKNEQGETPLQLADDQEQFRYARALEVIGTSFDTKKKVVRETDTSGALKKLMSDKTAARESPKAKTGL